MRVAVLTDAGSWLNGYLGPLVDGLAARGHEVVREHRHEALPTGLDAVFILSYQRIIPAEVLARSRHNLVVHQSDLPAGRGWSPLTWQVIEGRSEIPIVLFEAAPAVDEGPIYLRRVMRLAGHELWPELRAMQAALTAELCLEFCDRWPAIADQGRMPTGTASWHRKRTPADSRLDPARSIAEQFDLLRTVDNERYPAFLDHRGHRYVLRIEDQGPTP
jgi:methionyl-tRNA formyltransferase